MHPVGTRRRREDLGRRAFVVAGLGRGAGNSCTRDAALCRLG